MEIDGRQFSINRLRKYRRLCGLKQETVKRKLGLGSRNVLSDWENGKYYPPISRLLSLARLYGRSAVDLIPELGYILEPFDDAQTSDESR